MVSSVDCSHNSIRHPQTTQKHEPGTSPEDQEGGLIAAYLLPLSVLMTVSVQYDRRH